MAFTVSGVSVVLRPPYLDVRLGLPDGVVTHGGDLGRLGRL